MGWFLPWKQKHRRQAQREPESRWRISPGNWDGQRTLLGVRVFGIVALVVLLVGGWHVLDRGLSHYAANRPVAAAANLRVVLVNAPDWMGQSVRRQLAAVVADQLSSNPIDGNGLRSATASLAADPWVQRVEQIRRHADGQVSVEAEYREPIVLVRSAGGYRLVDRQGVCLPGLYTSNQVRHIDLPWVTGVGAGAPEVGAIWPGDDLAACLALVRRLAAEPYARQILRYDVSQRDEADRIRLTLHTAGGAVSWGFPPGQEQAIEEDAAVKVRRLRELAEAYGSINAGRQMVEIYGPWSPLDASGRLAWGNLGR